MIDKGKSTLHTVNSDKACISIDVTDLIYNKVEKNKVFRIKTLQQKLCIPENKEHMELDEEQENKSL